MATTNICQRIDHIFRNIDMLPVQYQFKNLNHLGLVAAMCRELKITEYIDARITNDRK
ncbi:DUF4277 domain-containing protein [Salinisphaera sp. G21_0]|nr:DUF4277 domain-containing protein [Salinisphaera sp. G21_0]